MGIVVDGPLRVFNLVNRAMDCCSPMCEKDNHVLCFWVSRSQSVRTLNPDHNGLRFEFLIPQSFATTHQRYARHQSRGFRVYSFDKRMRNHFKSLGYGIIFQRVSDNVEVPSCTKSSGLSSFMASRKAVFQSDAGPSCITSFGEGQQSGSELDGLFDFPQNTHNLIGQDD